MPKELEDRFQLTVSRDELTVITFGLTAAAGLFNGDINGSMLQMVAQYIPVKVRSGRDFEPALLSAIEKISMLAHHYREKQNESSRTSDPGSSGHNDWDASGTGA